MPSFKPEQVHNYLSIHAWRLTLYAGKKKYIDLANRGVSIQREAPNLTASFLEQCVDALERRIIDRDRPSIQKWVEGPVRQNKSK